MVADVSNFEAVDAPPAYIVAAPSTNRRAKSQGASFRADTRMPGTATIQLPARIPESCVMESARAYSVTPLLLLAMVKVDGSMVLDSGGDDGTRVARMRELYRPYVVKASQITGVPAALIDSVITVESSYNQQAVSPKGAIGLMQLMPGTASGLGVNPRDTWQNILGGSKYLAELGVQFNWDLNLMIASYNAGPKAVTKYGYRVPPYDETQAYVPKVMAIYSAVATAKSDPAAESFSNSDWAHQLEKKFNVSRSAFATNVCTALKGMAYAIRVEIDRANGDIWKAVGVVHSSDQKKRQIYISRVKFAQKQMALSGSY